jgi:hypothetical protein
VSAQRPLRLRQASAYFRLAAKADRAGNDVQARHYRGVAERLVDQERRDRERRRARGAR